MIGILRIVGTELGMCTEKSEKQFHERDGVLHVIVNPYEEKIYIDYDPFKVSWEEIRRLVEISTSQFDDTKLISFTNPPSICADNA